MKTLKKFLDKEVAVVREDRDFDSDDKNPTKDSLISMIANSLNRYKTSDKGDVRGILMLIAALQMLSAGGDSNLSISTARRLVSSSFQK